MLRCMWDLSSAPRDRACAPCVGHTVLTTGPPGKSFQPQTSLLRTLPRISESGGSVEAGHLPFPASLTRCVVSRARLPRSCFVGPTPPSAFYSRDIWGVNAVLSLDALATPHADLVIGGCNFPCLHRHLFKTYTVKCECRPDLHQEILFCSSFFLTPQPGVVGNHSLLPL